MTSKLEGSCLCGAVKYSVEGEILNFFHCHCRRCQKSTGTGHASNIILSDASLHWLSGEEDVVQFKVADAKVFKTVFCKSCGGNLPRHSEETGFAVVPAGSLDGDPELAVNARIFTGSAATWSCLDDSLPAFEKYPPRD